LREYVGAEFGEALEALGLSVQKGIFSIVATLPVRDRDVSPVPLVYIETESRVPGYDDRYALYMTATADDGISEKDWQDVALPALERAAEATGNVVYAIYTYGRVIIPSTYGRVIIPSWFPKQSVVRAAFSNTERKTAASVMSENRFRVPQEYRKQIGALLQQAAETNDLAAYLQAKHLAALVAE
jgi:hypothetical protein